MLSDLTDEDPNRFGSKLEDLDDEYENKNKKYKNNSKQQKQQ